MISNQSPAGAAVVFRDVVEVYHPGVRALDNRAAGLATVAMLRWRREATAAA